MLCNGNLAITVEPTNGQRYQGIVALQEGSLANNLDAYFEQSEQLKSRIWLAADGQRAAGLLLQQLPGQITDGEALRLQQWEKVSTLASTIQDAELLELESESLLHRLYYEDPVRLFAPKGVKFRCSCSRERTRNALTSLNPAELEELLAELGRITMDSSSATHNIISTGRTWRPFWGVKRPKRCTDRKFEEIPLLYGRYIFHNAAILT